MTTRKTKKAPRATPRAGMKPVARTKKTPADDGLSRAEIDRANAAGPGAVDALLRGAAKGGKAKTPAKGKTPAKATPTATPAVAPRPRDPRLPAPGTTLTRTFNGKEIKVEVLDAGFRHDGKTWRSLSAIAKAVSGTSWNGFLFFNLQKRAAPPAKTEKAAPATAEAK